MSDKSSSVCYVAPGRRRRQSGLSDEQILALDHSYGTCDAPDCPHGDRTAEPPPPVQDAIAAGRADRRGAFLPMSVAFLPPPLSPGPCPTCGTQRRERGEVRVHVWRCGCVVRPDRVTDVWSGIERVPFVEGHGVHATHPTRDGAVGAWREALAEAQRREDDMAGATFTLMDRMLTEAPAQPPAQVVADLERGAARIDALPTSPTLTQVLAHYDELVASLMRQSALRGFDRVVANGTILGGDARALVDFANALAAQYPSRAVGVARREFASQGLGAVECEAWRDESGAVTVQVRLGGTSVYVEVERFRGYVSALARECA